MNPWVGATFVALNLVQGLVVHRFHRDAETSLIFISPWFRSMTTGLGSPFFVIPNQVLKQVQDLRISGSRFLVLRIWVLKPRPVGGALY